MTSHLVGSSNARAISAKHPGDAPEEREMARRIDEPAITMPSCSPTRTGGDCELPRPRWLPAARPEGSVRTGAEGRCENRREAADEDAPEACRGPTSVP